MWGVILITVFAGGCSAKQSAAETKPPTDEQLKQIELLNAAADEMYRSAMDGDLDTARGKLAELGERVTATRFDGIASIEGVGALSEAIVQAKRVFQAVKYSPEQGKLAAAKIRLATDALTHANQPMWLQYYNVMIEDAERLEQAVRAGDKPASLAALGQLSARYAVIRPSVLITREPQEAEKIESLFAFFNNQLNAPQWEPDTLDNGMKQLRLAIDELFGRADKSAYAPFVDRPRPIVWITGIGSIIAAVLAFAWWRIFRYERTAIVTAHKGGKNRGW
jgi:sporulation protein YpjB